MRFGTLLQKQVMIIPFVALIAVIIVVILFFVLVGKKKQQGEDLGEHGGIRR
jgi:uncharacterized membrane protein